MSWSDRGAVNEPVDSPTGAQMNGHVAAWTALAGFAWFDVLWVIAQTNVGIADDSLQICEEARMGYQRGTVGPYRNSGK